MLHLRIHAKLLAAFIIVLLPVLGLLVVDLLSDLHRTREDILNVQFMTAQAVAGQASETHHFQGHVKGATIAVRWASGGPSGWRWVRKAG